MRAFPRRSVRRGRIPCAECARASGPARARAPGRVPARLQSGPRPPRRADAPRTHRGWWTRPPTRSRASNDVTAAPRFSAPVPPTVPRARRPRRPRSSPTDRERAILQDYTCGHMMRVLLSLLVSLQLPGQPSADLHARVQKIITASGADVAVVFQAVNSPRVSDQAGHRVPRGQHDEDARDDRAVPAGRREYDRSTSRSPSGTNSTASSMGASSN